MNLNRKDGSIGISDPLKQQERLRIRFQRDVPHVLQSCRAARVREGATGNHSHGCKPYIFPVNRVGQHEVDLDINQAKQKKLRTCREFSETCSQPSKQ